MHTVISRGEVLFYEVAEGGRNDIEEGTKECYGHSPAVKPVTHKLHSHYYYSIQGIATIKNKLLLSSETELKTNNTREEESQ